MKYTYFFDFFDNHLKNYNDHFCIYDLWKEETNKWLELLYNLDKQFYNKGKTRVGDCNSRDAFLAEAKAIYYCKNFLLVDNIQLEPICNGKNELDFSFIKNKEKYFIEVKGPSWRGEVFKNTDLSFSEKIRRLKQPQYLKSDSGSYSPKDAIEDSIKKALPKFVKNQKNILIIVPNMKIPVRHTPDLILNGFIKDELTRQDNEHLILGVAVLEIFNYLSKNKIEYVYKYFKYENLTAHRLTADCRLTN